jgi:hypothetical protein
MKKRMRKIGNGAKVAASKVGNGVKVAGKATWSGIKTGTKEAGTILREAAPGLVVIAAAGGVMAVLRKNGEEIAKFAVRSFVA